MHFHCMAYPQSSIHIYQIFQNLKTSIFFQTIIWFNAPYFIVISPVCNVPSVQTQIPDISYFVFILKLQNFSLPKKLNSFRKLPSQFFISYRSCIACLSRKDYYVCELEKFYKRQSLNRNVFNWVKSVQIRSFFLVRIFPHSGNVSLRIQSEPGKMRIRKNSVSGHFSHTVFPKNTRIMNYKNMCIFIPADHIYLWRCSSICLFHF